MRLIIRITTIKRGIPDYDFEWAIKLFRNIAGPSVRDTGRPTMPIESKISVMYLFFRDIRNKLAVLVHTQNGGP